MIRALVVDDEELARVHLIRILRGEPDVEVIGEAANGLEALEAISDLLPGVVFLDIEMPGMNGIEVVKNLRQPPPIVFATAYDAFAVKAFEANALDYLLKPVQPQRVRQTLARLKQNTGSENRDAMREVLSLMDRDRGAPLSKLAVCRGKRIILLGIQEVLHITIEDKLVFVHTGKERFLIERTVSEAEELLASSGFRRINRGTLVNMEHVRELVPWFSGTYKVKLTNGVELDVSRDRARQLTQAMGV
jgi:DNA-binding LytR/AlgR family response regulator